MSTISFPAVLARRERDADPAQRPGPPRCRRENVRRAVRDRILCEIRFADCRQHIL